MYRQIKRSLPALVWMGVIFYLSSLPNLELHGNLSAYDATLRKLAHLTEYAILYLLWQKALLPGRTNPKASQIAFVVSLVYAISDEVHQHFVPTRTAELSDLLFDASGIIIAHFYSTLPQEQG